MPSLPDTHRFRDESAKPQPPTKIIEGAEVKAEPYQADKRLREAVDFALTLGRPLLLQGEPGCGKTRLAYHVAFVLGWPLEAAYLKSASRAQDMLYQYDAVARLYDAQLQEARSRDVGSYVTKTALGTAIERAQSGKNTVVLLDEIDKADLDFPNDLLRELDRMEFTISESRVSYKAAPDFRPLVLITHNDDKALPPAFLRRCIFHFLTFPASEDELFDVVATHWQDEKEAVEPLARAAIRVLQNLRQVGGLSKLPGLSELLDWILWLHRSHEAAADLERLPFDQLPARGVLLKVKEDLETARTGYVPPMPRDEAKAS